MAEPELEAELRATMAARRGLVVAWAAIATINVSHAAVGRPPARSRAGTREN